MIMMALLWLISIRLRNVSIVDLFWGFGFLLVSLWGYIQSGGLAERKMLVLILVVIWSLRLSLYLAWRNLGKGEDFRYQQFRKQYGENRYWWISFFQTFLLQGILMWLISATLLAAQHFGPERELGWLDFTGVALWIIGLTFEAGGDYQLAKFRSDPASKGKVLQYRILALHQAPELFWRCSGMVGIWVPLPGCRKLSCCTGLTCS